MAALDIDPSRVAYVTPTGKAAQVLRSKGNDNAMTIHKLLYKHYPRKNGTFYRRQVSSYELRKRYDLFVVDEVSMVPKEMWDLLLTHKIYTIACGDPAQLPSVTEGTDVLDKPHIFLDEIMRQAQESEIIRLTMDIRAGKRIRPYKGKEINIVRKRDFIDGMVKWADVTICAMNKTRKELNDAIRKNRYGEDVGPLPLENETMICLRNNWEIINNNGDALVNGEVGQVSNICINNYPMSDFYEKEMYLNFNIDKNASFKTVLTDYKLLTVGESTVNEENFKFFRGRDGLPIPNEFDFGYCLTAWKAQGDEWDKVLVLEEKWPWNKEEKKRFLYTACTRSVKKLTLVLSK